MMNAAGVWLGNQAWPNNRSCGQFAKDVFRISGARTDKEKALAFYDWYIRCMMRGGNLMCPDGAGSYSRCYDPLPILTSWGHGECTFWGWVATECLAGAGLKTRRTCVHQQGHTYHESWYAGDDGVEQWHAFDPFQGWYFVNESGEVASCAQLAADPQLVQNPLPGHPTPLGYHPDRAGLEHRHRTEDNLNIDHLHWFEQLDWQLRRGQEVTINFMPAEPHLTLFPYNDVGSHCSIPEIGRLGGQVYPQHMPYWRNYMWPARGGPAVRWHGSGALRWKPLQYGAAAACDARNAKFENGCLKPTGPHDFCEVWYHFKLPYLANSISVAYDVAGGGGDHFGLCLSADGRRSWWSMMERRSTSPGWGTVLNGQEQWKERRSSVQGLREFWLRVDLATHAEKPTLAVQALNVTVGFQHNMYIQPRLLPGENPLWLEAAELADGAKLRAEWIYQLGGEERRAAVELAKPGRAADSVVIDADCPSDVHTTGIRLCCL